MFARPLAILGLFGALAGVPQPLAAEEAITVFAAASLKNALDDTDAAFSKAMGIKVVAGYAASYALVKQIEQGAPADVFISADLRWMDYAAEHRLIKPDSRVNLLGNRLVLIAPKDSKLDTITIAKGFDIAKLAGDGRIAVADAKIEPKVKIVGIFPDESYPPVTYPVAATAVTTNAAVARYLNFLRSSAAKAIFEKYGFSFLIRPVS